MGGFSATSGQNRRQPLSKAAGAGKMGFLSTHRTQNVVALQSFWYKAALFSRGPVPSFVGVAGKTPKETRRLAPVTERLSGQPMPGWACGFRGLRHVESMSSYR